MDKKHTVKEEEQKEKSILFKIVDFLFWPLLTFVVVLLLFRFVVFHGYVPSQSMETTIESNSWIIGERVSILRDKNNISRYDVIVFKGDLGRGEEHIVKRVIGLPGDKIKITNEDIFVNGEKVLSSFTSSIDKYQQPEELTVPKDSYFVCGDNRDNSNDSRKWINPFVKNDKIVAKVWSNYKVGRFSILEKYEDNIKRDTE